MREEVNWRIVVMAIAALVILELFALSRGIDGILLTTVIAIIAGLAGWTLPQASIMKGGHYGRRKKRRR